jgi:hypothetical protein
MLFAGVNNSRDGETRALALATIRNYLARVLEPRAEMIEGFATRDIVDEQCAGGTAIVGARDRSERLLARLHAPHAAHRDFNRRAKTHTTPPPLAAPAATAVAAAYRVPDL